MNGCNKYNEMYAFDAVYYLDFLMYKILNTIFEMKELYNIYLKTKNNNKMCKNENIYLLNVSFSEMKQLFWYRFCIQMRDLIKTIYHIITHSEDQYNDSKKKKYKIKNEYEQIIEYINNESKFLIKFWKNDYKKSISLLSYELHNCNNYEYGDDKANNVKENYPKFNDALSLDLSLIQNEFSDIISLFREIENVKDENFDLFYREWSPIFEILKLIKK